VVDVIMGACFCLFLLAKKYQHITNFIWVVNILHYTTLLFTCPIALLQISDKIYTKPANMC